MDIIAAGSVIIAKELFTKLCSDIYQLVREQTGQQIQLLQSKIQISKLYRRMDQIKKVKTIWQIDKPVDLMEFYCDSHVIIANKRKKITKIADFGEEKHILIQGIAGQGKSIFLRYLCSVELINAKCIPLFLEMRRISKEHSLIDRIYAGFEALGITINDEIFNVFANSGKIILLLDAYDEIPEEIKSRILTDIEDLGQKYEKLRIIITSRPHQSIERSNIFTVVKLDNLIDGEYLQVIHKLAGGQDWAEGLIAHIEKKAQHIRGLLVTPLMVTLLVMSFKSCQKLPSKLSDFYDALFQLLLQRHDGTKPGYSRQRSCSLDDSEYRKVFETICILCKRTGLQSFTSKNINDLAKNALEQNGHKISASKFVEDIVKITCLILKEGDDYRYIHKTVNEYYTASYIQQKPESWAATFYNRVLTNRIENIWQQELEFLSEIDSFRYNKYYLLPSILTFLQREEKDLDSGNARMPTIDQIEEITGSIEFFFKDDKLYMIRTLQDYRFYLMGIDVFKIIKMLNFSTIGEQLQKGGICVDWDGKEPSEEGIPLIPKHNDIKFKKCVLIDGIKAGILPEVDKELDKEFKRIFNTAKTIYSTMRVEENPSILEGLV